jgi:serine/threonine protein kinase
VKKYVRKELKGTPPLRFLLEKDSLEKVKPLKTPHIVKMVKAYRHGETFNIIFPCAMTNLNHYLREDEYHSTNFIQGPIESSPLWQQALGITKALGIINRIPSTSDDSPSSEGGAALNGFHFDLKPANILVEENNSWVITDFGMARFEKADGSTSRVVNQPGTDAYAPPEYLNIESKFSRKYDVWSLGCILLEVTAFILQGYDGLKGKKGLDSIRCTTTSHMTEHRFFCVEVPGKYRLKPEISGFMDDLIHAERALPPSSQQFLVDVLCLIREMLDPKAETRIEIGNVIARLEGIVGHSTTPTVTSPLPARVAPFPGEVDLTTALLRQTTYVHTLRERISDAYPFAFRCYHMGSGNWEQARIHIFGSANGGMRLVTSDPSSQKELFNSDCKFFIP